MIKGRWPSGKAQVFGTCMRRFESYPPCLLFDTVTEFIKKVFLVIRFLIASKPVARNEIERGFKKGTSKSKPMSFNRKV